MDLSELIAPLAGTGIGGGVEITGIAYDSRQVKPGDLFVAIRGHRTDGHRYICQAVERGASAVITEEPVDGLGLPHVVVSDARAALAVVSGAFYDDPTSRLSLVGITGTNGKTTTSFLVESIFRAAGFSTGLIGTVESHIGTTVEPVVRTTPESSDLQSLFRRMVDAGVGAAVMEVSSHALALNRVDGCDFDVAVFTNLSRDHLDYHPSIEDYFEAKRRLFKPGAKAVVNIDDEYGARLASDLGPGALSFSTRRPADVTAEDIRAGVGGASFSLVAGEEARTVDLKLPGAFNVENALAAAGSALALGIPLDTVVAGLEALTGVPGRFESILNGRESAVIVDYAHTPDGLERLLTSAREIAGGRLICVFGCGGDRDRTKRGLMGGIAGMLADHTVITSDNPRSEEPMAIISEIEKGIRRVSGAVYEIIEDRRQAIKRAISMAERGDMVVIAGKGHECGQTFAMKTVPFDDRQVAREILEELGS
ncbi:MAG: UDP-N-acetylmuramoyl-L-alanyl-D-glutamate--2,6-diaminopimelate ligase [Candidatus Aquicultorales bacterium]